jgi:hypothetical protein
MAWGVPQPTTPASPPSSGWDPAGWIRQQLAGLTAPDITDEAIIRRQLATKQRLASMQGRSASFLTGPMGLGGPSAEMARSFLLAKIHAVDQSAAVKQPMAEGPPEGPPGKTGIPTRSLPRRVLPTPRRPSKFFPELP